MKQPEFIDVSFESFESSQSSRSKHTFYPPKKQRKTCIEYQKLERLGKGTYGVVYKSRVKNGDSKGELVAVKKFVASLEEDGIGAVTLREISIIKACDHPNVVKMIDVDYDVKKSRLLFAMPLYEKDLKGFINSAVGPLSARLVKNCIHQILKAVHHIHSRGFMHRDLKPQNILVSYTTSFDECKIAVADLMGRQYNYKKQVSMTPEVATLWYRAPEILLGQSKYSTNMDLWSVGCILAEMLFKKPLFPGDSEWDQLMKIFKVLGTPTDNCHSHLTTLSNYKQLFPKWDSKFDENFSSIDPLAKDLLKHLLQMCPGKRICCKKSLEHPFFTHSEWNDVTDSLLKLDNINGELDLCDMKCETNIHCTGCESNYMEWMLNYNHLFAGIFDICQTQNDITNGMRYILYDWLIEVMQEYHLEHATLFRTITMCDLMLSKHAIYRQSLQAFGVTCMLLACKIEEIFPPGVDDFVYISDNTFSKSKLIEIENTILSTLNYDLFFPTVHSYIDIIDDINHFTKMQRTAVLFLCYRALFNDNFFYTRHPKYVAAAACYLVLSNSSKCLQLPDGISMSEVKRNAKLLWLYVKDNKEMKRSKLQATSLMFERSKYFKVSTILYDNGGQINFGVLDD